MPGTHFTRDAPDLRRMVLMVMETTPRVGHLAHTLHRGARLEDLTVGPRELLDLLSRAAAAASFPPAACFSPVRLAESYRKHLEQHRHAFGSLAPGDRVSGWITGLGRQEWEVLR